MPKCIILSGIPNSGKSTWAKNQKLKIISCDKLRLMFNNGKYKYNPELEKRVWDYFYYILNNAEIDFIVDNTNCKQGYINKIKENLNKKLEWDVEIKRFDIPLWKAHYRNVIRYLKTGKWIPIKTINNFYKNYNQLWKKDV